MKAILFLLILLPVLGKVTMAQEAGKDEKAVMAAVESLRKLMIDPDKSALEKLTMDQLSYGHSGGNIQTKTEFVDALVSGTSDFVTIDLTKQTVVVVGSTAIVRHVLSAANNDGGKPGQVKLSVLLVWQKARGDWKLLARQAVKLPM